jgi:AraC-like DNA-binding protein
MSSSIPLIRASALIPLELWLVAKGRPAAEIHDAYGLPRSPAQTPARPVALHAVMHMLGGMAEIEGPDFSARISTPDAFMQTGAPARAIRASRTVREALVRISDTLHQQSSHVFFHANQVVGGVEIVGSIPTNGTAEMHHQAQQTVAALVRIIGVFANGSPLPARIWIAPHPRFGLDHLKGHLGEDIAEGAARQLRMWIPDSALDLAFPWEPDAGPLHLAENRQSIGCASLRNSARVLIAGMVADGNPGIDRLALCSGRSKRTLQRLLAAEGTSFAELLDSVKSDHVLGQLQASGNSVSSIATRLGYRNASSLTRAVRRWTDETPREFRRGTSGHGRWPG